ncbi:MAG: murein biosynthesis integral membrane protein MurJ [Oscillatoria sp. PMC 1051.18]|uniref:murein biosynthesis integral membrane protein MurJ n=1 Tax=Oscillatoria salina TaxID=331517 RepID=UPI0013B98446|nr:murein biosynthesis integral membrane protein MurJ [Oscillatoria salina]MBZ8179898.1 murein biosynthesis integral membrane protein MurJ [Oscillatoria salina IIICB1]MEC4891986.1 murein biosynthesis integral membrane protein MurJ [Oscillatoria sp. PMC 1050.18]MEC5028612.1 murein biosynthesis integral membrane protein MurJ [Oscillatoria sp. PMC 1051.18]NET87445.1 murein biosynthesis integral membrane protein MurJ [Kamptonema sp. SIO1D9]
MAVNKKPTRSLASIASIVAAATLISKVFGLFREQAIAAAFGVGPVVNAYAFAYVIPGFLLVLLGGINGPFHSALVSVLARRNQSETAPIVETVTTIVGGTLLLVAIALYVFAPTCIDLVAPGLSATAEGLEVRNLAILQLQIMAPLAVLAGLIGIGFGTLNASDRYWLPSLSPVFSSLAILLGIGWLVFFLGVDINAPQYLKFGAILLAGATLAGGVWQWFAQLIAQWRSGLGTLRLRFNLGNSGVKEVMKVMIPATFSSGMLHVNVYTDLFFASYIENAAAALRYANFIVLTPLGIISNMILVPMLPIFSRLAAPENWQQLKIRIRQGLLLTALTMLPLTALFVALGFPIVRVVYQRFAFGEEASAIVAPVLIVYGLGMFFYLGRDVLVRVFYALGDGKTPFQISMANILLNAVLDYFLVQAFATPGLVLATIGVNVTSIIVMLAILHRRLNGLPLLEWSLILLALTGGSLVAGLASFSASWSFASAFGTDTFLLQLLQLGIGTIVGLGIFILFVTQLRLPEVDILVARVKQKFGK